MAISLINWLLMLRCDIVHPSPPIPPRIGFSPPPQGARAFFWCAAKIGSRLSGAHVLPLPRLAHKSRRMRTIQSDAHPRYMQAKGQATSGSSLDRRNPCIEHPPRLRIANRPKATIRFQPKFPQRDPTPHQEPVPPQNPSVRPRVDRALRMTGEADDGAHLEEAVRILPAWRWSVQPGGMFEAQVYVRLAREPEVAETYIPAGIFDTEEEAWAGARQRATRALAEHEF